MIPVARPEPATAGCRGRRHTERHGVPGHDRALRRPHRGAGAATRAIARTALGGALIPLGDADAGLAELAAAIRLDAQAGEVVDLLRAVVNHSDGLLTAGRPEDAVVAALDGLQQARRLGLAPAFGPDLACNATEALFALGRWDQAERVSREGLEASPIGAAEVSLPMARATGRGEPALRRAAVRPRRPHPGRPRRAGQGAAPRRAGPGRRGRRRAARAARRGHRRAGGPGGRVRRGRVRAGGRAPRRRCRGSR
jgi:hypothetical protein